MATRTLIARIGHPQPIQRNDDQRTELNQDPRMRNLARRDVCDDGLIQKPSAVIDSPRSFPARRPVLQWMAGRAPGIRLHKI